MHIVRLSVHLAQAAASSCLAALSRGAFNCRAAAAMSEPPPPPLRAAVVCASNMNRSMEAHRVFQAGGMSVCSFGVGQHVKLPGYACDSRDLVWWPPATSKADCSAVCTPSTQCFARLPQRVRLWDAVQSHIRGLEAQGRRAVRHSTRARSVGAVTRLASRAATSVMGC